MRQLFLQFILSEATSELALLALPNTLDDGKRADLANQTALLAIQAAQPYAIDRAPIIAEVRADCSTRLQCNAAI
jgi:hypothetical protein